VFTATSGTSAAEIFLINANGSQLQRLTYEPSTSASRSTRSGKPGIAIVLASTRQNPSHAGLWSVALDGSQLLRLTQTPETSGTHLSPDGTQLAG
jgi:Tol biopolymer transport system component